MFKLNHTKWHAVVAALLVVAIAYITGCDSKSVSDDVPVGTTVDVNVSPGQVPSGDNAVVEATLENAGTAIANQEVTFTVEPASAGYFSKQVDTTDVTGVAATIFTATTTGTATIRVSVNGSTVNGTTGVQITSGTGGTQQGTANISMTVTPTLLLANGADTAAVAVTVRDLAGNVAPNGTLVRFTAGEKFDDKDDNGYWSPGIDSLIFDANASGNWDAYGLIPSSATIAGGAGQVNVNYVAGSDAYTIYIKASVDENGLTGSKDVPLQLSPNASINSIYLRSDSLSLSVKQTGGIETGLIFATCYDENGNRVPEGLTVNFIIVDGPGGGEHFGTVGYGPFVSLTNSQGIAQSPLSSGTVSGTIRVRAYADTVLSNATQVLVAAGPPYDIVVGSEACNADWWDNVGNFTIITAVVSDVYNNPVNDSTVVYFTADEGVMKAHELRTQENEGIARTRWFAGEDEAQADGRVWIFAETAGGTVRDSSMFFNTHFTDTLVVLGVPSSIPADGFSKVGVNVWGYDLNDNPVIGGTTFKAEANYLNVTGGTLEDGCYSSWSRSTITSALLKTDASMNGVADNGIGAIDFITFYAGAGAASTFQIQLNTGSTYSGNSLITGQTAGAPLEVINFSVTIKDRFGNPLGDHDLVMTATGGTILQGTGSTDSYGEAFGFRWQAPNGIGSFSIIITDTDPRGGIVLTKTVTIEVAS